MPKSDVILAFAAVLLFCLGTCHAHACPEKPRPRRCDMTCHVDSGGHQICKTVCR